MIAEGQIEDLIIMEKLEDVVDQAARVMLKSVIIVAKRVISLENVERINVKEMRKHQGKLRRVDALFAMKKVTRKLIVLKEAEEDVAMIMIGGHPNHHLKEVNHLVERNQDPLSPEVLDAIKTSR